MIEKDDPRLVFIAKEDFLPKKRGLFEAYVNIYAPMYEDKLIVFKINKKDSGCIQGNTNKIIADQIGNSLYPWATIELIPLVLLPINPHDYT